jgi:hypothetical protein
LHVHRYTTPVLICRGMLHVHVCCIAVLHMYRGVLCVESAHVACMLCAQVCCVLHVLCAVCAQVCCIVYCVYAQLCVALYCVCTGVLHVHRCAVCCV